MIKKIFLILIIVILFIFSGHSPAIAADDNCSFNLFNDKYKPELYPNSPVNYNIKVKDTKSTYRIKSECDPFDACVVDQTKTPQGGSLIGSFTINPGLDYDSTKIYSLIIERKDAAINPYCQYQFTFTTPPTPTSSKRAQCKLFLLPDPHNVDSNTSLTISGALSIEGFDPKNAQIIFDYNNPPTLHVTGNYAKDFTLDVINTNTPPTFKADILKWPDGKYTALADINVKDSNDFTSNIPVVCSFDFQVPGGIISPTPTATPIPTPTPPAVCSTGNWLKAEEAGYCGGDYAYCPWCPTPVKRPGIEVPNLKPLCDQLPAENNYRDECWKCQKSGGIWSAIGCLPTDFSALIKEKVFPVGLGIAGGVAFLYFLYGAFMILTSSGNAETIEEAKQIITSALAGLLLIIFSIFLLQVIGVQILQLPGFK